tara:strand:- start:914 stop:1444 length:531 start_codon:yes stop_codon:yes gene_type:complete
MEENQIIASNGTELLHDINNERGLLWEKIERLANMLVEHIPNCATHVVGTPQSQKMKDLYPLKQHIKDGLYTREVFMPKDNFIVSMIHKQNHPSFLLKGELSFISDNGEVKDIKAPYTIFTKAGTQRVFYTHEDTIWSCVFKTDELTFEQAEADVFSTNYRELPIELINKNKLLCQ